MRRIFSLGPGPAGALIGLALRGYVAVRTVGWFFTRPEANGVRAIALTEDGAVVLVRHSYLRGWHLPGGGQNPGEAPLDAVLRELREEAGMTGHGAATPIARFRQRPNFRHGVVTLFLVEDVAFRFRPSLEIVEARAFDPADLPAEATPATRARIAEWREGKAPPTNW